MTRPELHIAVAGQKNKASEYNDNFDMMMTYCEDEAQSSKNYVDSFMPTQTGNANKFLKTNGSSTSWVYVGGDFPYSGYIDGLIISRYSADTISVTAGSCFDETRTQVLTLGSATTKENSSQTASTTYYIYLINNGTISDILITTESTNPTLPAGYTYYRLIGNYITNADAEIDEHNPQITNLSSSYNPTGLKENSINGKNGYVIYSNKLCEQWGYIAPSPANANTINLTIEMADGDYSIWACRQKTTTGGTFYDLYVQGTPTSKSFVIDNHGGSEGLYWHISGYAK